MKRTLLFLLSCTVLSLTGTGTTQAADWLHWRGPDQTGFSRETNLPDEWDPTTPGRNNLVWKAPYGCRSTPLIMNGKAYIVSSLNDTPKPPTPAQRLIMGEQVVCLDAKTGKTLWTRKFNVFHTDIVMNRLGWSPLAADPENKLVFAHLTGGQFVAFQADTGDTVWEHSLTEEYGRVTGYGGRIGGGPIFDSGLVIVGIVQASWGNLGVGANRWVAFDSKTGKVVWWAESPGILRGTYYSNPVVAVIKGERLMITGGADGGVHAFQVRTGKRVWSYTIATGVINPSPVVNGNYVYISHGEENPESGAGIGRVVCLDAGTIRDGKPDLVWDFRKGIRFGLASLAFADGLLYVPDDAAKLYCFDGKTGKQLWKYNYGTVSRGAPLIADGKIYLSETNYKFHIIKLNGKQEPDESETHTITFKNKPGAVGFVEVNCTPSVADGRVYLATRDEVYCIANLESKEPKGTKSTPEPKPLLDPPAKPDDPIAQLQLFPADVVAKPGEKITFEVRAYNAAGALIPMPALKGEWSLPTPPLPKGAKQPPPPLDGTISDTGVLSLSSKPAQQGYVNFKMGDVVGTARVRVAPSTSYSQDFKMVPEGAVPAGWVNAQLKYGVREIGGEKVLFKKNDDPRPPIARAIAYITMPDANEYTIEAELKGVEKKEKLPDAGIVANRYVFYLDGKTDEKGDREARLISWEALPRINVAIPYTWKSDVWYRLKMTVTSEGNETVIRCKVWESGKDEPAQWNIEFKDPSPNRNGSAGLYSYITNAEPENPGSEIHFRSVKISPNNKK
jgi:outer membrane protein assembly factor BamB